MRQIPKNRKKEETPTSNNSRRKTPSITPPHSRRSSPKKKEATYKQPGHFHVLAAKRKYSPHFKSQTNEQG